ncbi:hypothetical protein JW872_00710 [Candidatus Babeliales bacterium]|nr:hypothetical protein [Candidatus Babeliales bacterium]
MKQRRTSHADIRQSFLDDEMILVVKRDDLFPQGAWSGLQHVPFDEILATIKEKQLFMPRSHMETDPTYKQIIPYLLFEYDGRYFLMQRSPATKAQDLRYKYSLGIGGHIRQDDMKTSSILAWADREFKEEIEYNGTYKAEPIGILNDDSNPIGQVHVGLVFILKGDSPHIKVKDEHISGTLLPLEELKDFYPRMESWSRIVFDFMAEKHHTAG